MADHTQIDLLLQANELARKQEYREALALYLQAIQLYGQSSDLAAMVATCFFALALLADEAAPNSREAVTWMGKALELAPDDSRLHTLLAQIYWLGLLDYEQAVREFRRAIELNPRNIWALGGAAALWGVPEDVIPLGEAIEYLERATGIEPDNPLYHFRLGELYRKAGRLQEMEREWTKALLCSRPLDEGPAQAIGAGGEGP